jgi:hypothetical protein
MAVRTMPPFRGEDGSLCGGPRRILGTIPFHHTSTTELA